MVKKNHKGYWFIPIEYINKNKFDFEKWETQMILNILQGKSDK